VSALLDEVAVARTSALTANFRIPLIQYSFWQLDIARTSVSHSLVSDPSILETYLPREPARGLEQQDQAAFHDLSGCVTVLPSSFEQEPSDWTLDDILSRQISGLFEASKIAAFDLVSRLFVLQTRTRFLSVPPLGVSRAMCYRGLDW